MYDIIGDIHGERATLESLLKKLGYTHGFSGYRHPNRKAIFIGDLIDRGPDSPGVCRIVREMCEGGAALAVLGNHELNAIGFHTPDPGYPGEYFRPHNDKNTKQHQETLDQYQGRDSELADTLEWFKTLPAFLELEEGLRVIHAAWSADEVEQLRGGLDYDHCLRKGSEQYQMLDTLLKGVEEKLPSGLEFTDKDNHVRGEARIKWWLDDLRLPWKKIALGPPDLINKLPDEIASIPRTYGYPSNDVPVFVGHYWLQGKPEPLRPNVACVDYSVAKEGGKLVAYRWDGEQQLVDDRFISVPRVCALAS